MTTSQSIIKNNSKKSLDVIRKENWLIVAFPKPHETLSWAIFGGGKKTTRHVIWRRVENQELNNAVDPGDFLKKELRKISLPDAIGLLTSADLDSYVDTQKNFGSYWVRIITTVGMDNACRVGEVPSRPCDVGTINILCQFSAPLSDNAFLEAISIATEARTLAVLESTIPSIGTQKSATGTGTDCLVIAAPQSEGGHLYIGKHTILGHLLGLSVYESVKLGIQRYKERGERE